MTDGVAAPQEPGRPAKEQAIRSTMEQAYGMSFSDVSLREDEVSAQKASTLGAPAYQEGNEIGFAPGGFDPDSAAGMHVLAHEFAHVAQARASETASISAYETASGEAHEQEANAAADAVLRGERPTIGAHRFSIAGYKNAPGGAPKPSATDDKIAKLQHDVDVQKKKTAALGLDIAWRATFGEELAHREQAIARIAGAMDDAVIGFQNAHVSQAQTDAIKLQLIGALATVTFAAGFEWAFAGMLGQMGVSVERATKIIEKVENPANAAASGSVNVAGAVAASGGTPSAGQTALGQLATNMEHMAKLKRMMESAFKNRAAKLNELSDEQWLKFDEKAVEAEYKAVLTEINKTKGADSLKDRAALANTFECHLWARWIQSQREGELSAARAIDEASASSGGSIGLPQAEAEAIKNPKYTVGTDIEDRLNAVGISKLAGVTLTGHWYSSNEPDNWRTLLVSWASGYQDPLAAK